MITLNCDRGLVRVGEWDDVINRIGFETSLDPTKHELASIIGRYVQPDKVPCGLSNCRTPHVRGYIVLTKDGLETNIGHDCGKNYFGVDFETMSRQFDRIIEEKEKREQLWSFVYQVDDISKKVTDLRKGERGADWVHKRSRPLVNLNDGCPACVVRYVQEMVKSSSDVVKITKMANKEETDQEEARLGRSLVRPHYMTESVGTIQGVRALDKENDLRDLLVLDLETNLAKFKEKNVDKMTFEELRHWSKWSVTVEPKLDKAIESIGLGQTLLVPRNLKPLKRIISDGKDHDEFSAYLTSLK